jgi:hypothetical protein
MLLDLIRLPTCAHHTPTHAFHQWRESLRTQAVYTKLS